MANGLSAVLVDERGAFGALFGVNVDKDLFEIRRANEGSGNPYCPESLLTGREIRAGLGYDCPRVGPLAAWKVAIEGGLTPQQVEQQLPRVTVGQARKRIGAVV